MPGLALDVNFYTCQMHASRVLDVASFEGKKDEGRDLLEEGLKGKGVEGKFRRV